MKAVERQTSAVDRQAERTSKPVICLRRKNFNPSDRDLLEPQVNVEALIPITVRNVGNGTALEVHWRFKKESGDEIFHGMIPNLQAKRYMNTGLNANQLGLLEGVPRIFECDYLSVNRDKYRCIIRLEGLKMVTFGEQKIN